MVIARARLALRVTQRALATPMGLTARAVSRWERGESGPSRRHRRELVTIVHALNPTIAAELAAAFARLYPVKKKKGDPPPPPPPRTPPDAGAFERSLETLANRLDLSPKRTWAFALELLQGVAAARFALDEASAHLESLLRRS